MKGPVFIICYIFDLFSVPCRVVWQDRGFGRIPVQSGIVQGDKAFYYLQGAAGDVRSAYESCG